LACRTWLNLISPPSPASDPPVPDFSNTITCPTSSAENSDAISISDTPDDDEESLVSIYDLSSEVDADYGDVLPSPPVSSSSIRSSAERALSQGLLKEELGRIFHDEDELDQDLEEEVNSSDLTSNNDGPDEEPITFSSYDAINDPNTTMETSQELDTGLSIKEEVEESQEVYYYNQDGSAWSEETHQGNDSLPANLEAIRTEAVQQGEEFSEIGAISAGLGPADRDVRLVSVIEAETGRVGSKSTAAQSRISIDHLVNKTQDEEPSNARDDSKAQTVAPGNSDSRLAENSEDRHTERYPGLGSKRKAMNISTLIEQEDKQWSQKDSRSSTNTAAAGSSNMVPPNDTNTESDTSSLQAVAEQDDSSDEALQDQDQDQDESPRKRARSSSHFMSALVGAVVGSVGIVYALAATAPPLS
jgi:hypothetical protein